MNPIRITFDILSIDSNIDPILLDTDPMPVCGLITTRFIEVDSIEKAQSIVKDLLVDETITNIHISK